jgi:uncharacterized MAPEG superfamily protein
LTIALWCVLAAGLLPYVAAGIAKADPNYDNRDPRGWLARQQGFRLRANAAQANAFEALPLFAAAVLTAHLLHGPQRTADVLALGFMAARVLHLACYLGDWPLLRSCSWVCGMGCVIALFVHGS